MTEGEGAEGESTEADRAAEVGTIRAVLRSGGGRAIGRLLPTNDELVRQEKQQDIALKRTYARRLLRMMQLQVFMANAVFIAYAWAGANWKIDATVMQVWLAATVVQIIGVVVVVTRYLFPRRDAGSDPPDPPG